MCYSHKLVLMITDKRCMTLYQLLFQENSTYSRLKLPSTVSLDHIIPLSEGELMHRSVLSKNKKILVVESANHNNIIYCLRDKYFKDIRVFIDSI